MKINAIQAILGLSFFGSVEGSLGYGKCDIDYNKEVDFSEDIVTLQDCESLCTNTVECESYQWYDNGSPPLTFFDDDFGPSRKKCVLYSEPVVKDLIHDTVCYKNEDGVMVEVGPGWCMRPIGYTGCGGRSSERFVSCENALIDQNRKYMEVQTKDDGFSCLYCGTYGDGPAPSGVAEAVCANKASQATTTAFVAPAEFDVTLSTSPGCAFTAGTNNIGTITCTFDTKGAADYTVNSALYGADCSTDEAPTGVSLDTSSTDFNPALVSGTQYESTYVVTLPIANSAAAAGSASIVFCLKTEVKDKNGDVYDWTNQKITKPIDVIGGFSTDSLLTETFNGEATDEELERSSYGVGINRCDENGVEVSDGATLAVGENFFLCVKGSQSQVVVSNIGEMTAAKTGLTDLSIVTEVGDGSGEGTLNSNTFVYGYGQNQVVIATRLPATFFASSGPVTFSGSANIAVGARRRLSRSMQVASASSEESANFSMDIQVAGMDDASSASSSAIKTTAAMFFAAAVAALIV